MSLQAYISRRVVTPEGVRAAAVLVETVTAKMIAVHIKANRLSDSLFIFPSFVMATWGVIPATLASSMGMSRLSQGCL